MLQKLVGGSSATVIIGPVFMGRIDWIEATADRFGRKEFESLVDKDEAIQIARKETLGIDEPKERIEAFVDDLPVLFEWFGGNYRDFPWRRTRNPWAIIVAEIMLQRTHAAKAAEVYRTFFERFSGPDEVCVMEFDEIFDVIEPLGFGNKKTNTLMTLAETLVTDHGGEVPNDLEVLLQLPRIGQYTARACLCFSYGEPYAIVDANIKTVVEDVFGYHSPRRAHKDDALYALLDALIPKESDAARVFNLALLDTRAEKCGSESEWSVCPLAGSCSNRELSN